MSVDFKYPVGEGKWCSMSRPIGEGGGGGTLPVWRQGSHWENYMRIYDATIGGEEIKAYSFLVFAPFFVDISLFLDICSSNDLEGARAPMLHHQRGDESRKLVLEG